MTSPDHDAEVDAIKDVVARQFASLGWGPDAEADWNSFAADFLNDAALYPAARPLQKQSVEAFVERMKGLARTKLSSFHEKVLGTEVTVFGNVAVAVAGCEISENDSEVNRGVEMLLLVKDGGVWKIAAQAWDGETEANPLPSMMRRDNE